MKEELQPYGGYEIGKYCHMCGRLLIRTKEFASYSSEDGTPKYNTILKCPVLGADWRGHLSKRRLWRKFDSDGDEIVELNY